MIGRIIDAGWTRQVDFLKSLVRLASDNPPGDCAPHAEAAATALEGLGFAVERHPVPDALVQEVIEYLERMGAREVEESELVHEDVHFRLPTSIG